MQKKIKTVLKLTKIIISALKNVESINMTAKVVKKNKKSPILLKECQLANTDKNK